MVLVQGSWRMVVVYGAISVLLLCIFNFGWFGIVQQGHTNATSPALERLRQNALETERKVNEFNACLATAGTNLKKVHVCQRARYGN